MCEAVAASILMGKWAFLVRPGLAPVGRRFGALVRAAILEICSPRPVSEGGSGLTLPRPLRLNGSPFVLKPQASPLKPKKEARDHFTHPTTTGGG